MGSKSAGEMRFWTKDQYLRFSDEVMDKPLSFHAFETLYWCGVREGELLALKPRRFDFERGTLTVAESYQRIDGQDVLTDPKTPKSKRVIAMPRFYAEEMEAFLSGLGLGPDERIFPVTKHFLSHEMARGSKAAGLEPIRVHDLRHSHVSLLIDMGFSALAIADRMGHEAADITYRYAPPVPQRPVPTWPAPWTGREGRTDMPCPNSARERSVTIGFRVTPEQARRIDLMARTSGMTKQDYLYKRALEEEVVVRPDVRVYKMLRDEMARVYRELRRIRSAGEVDEGLAWTVDFLARGVLRHARRGGALGRRAGGRPHLRHVAEVTDERSALFRCGTSPTSPAPLRFGSMSPAPRFCRANGSATSVWVSPRSLYLSGEVGYTALQCEKPSGF